MQREMQETLLPWATPLALVTLGFLFAGFYPTNGPLQAVLLGVVVSFALTAVFTWAAFLLEPQSVSNSRECLDLLWAGRTRQALSQMSTASVLLVTLCVLGVICALGSAIAGDAIDKATTGNARINTERFLLAASPVIFVWTIIVAIRDFCVAHALQAMTRTSTRAMGAFAVYITVMYFAVPLLLASVSKSARDFWLPTSTSASAACLIGAMASLAVVLLLSRKLWRTRGVAAVANQRE